MSVLSENLRLLRNSRKLSQQKLAEELIITRVRLASYEDARSEPPIVILKKLAGYFHISIDVLISVPLNKTAIEKLSDLPGNRIFLPVTVDKDGKDNVEVVPVKAKAGYLSGYGDPEYIESLQQMRIPFIGSGKHRAFPISGDSMPPYGESTFVVGRYIESLKDIKDGKTYILVSKDEGIVFKRVYRKVKTKDVWTLVSDNSSYAPYEIRSKDILEIWEFTASISTKETQADDQSQETIRDMLGQLKTEIISLKKNMVK